MGVEASAWSRYDSIFKKYSKQYTIPWTWLKAIAIQESSLGEDKLVKNGLVSRDGLSYGIMQITLTTASDLLQRGALPSDLNDPEVSICLAAKYLKLLLAMFDGDRKKAVMSYNQGPGNTLRGKEYAVNYYEKFLSNLRLVERRDQEVI
jgi:soluble lytic murein transglycosylase-like protein